MNTVSLRTYQKYRKLNPDGAVTFAEFCNMPRRKSPKPTRRAKRAKPPKRQIVVQPVSHPLPEPVQFMAGSMDKINAMAERAARGEQLFSPGDCPLVCHPKDVCRESDKLKEFD